MLVFFAFGNAKVLSFGLGNTKLPDTSRFSSQWKIGLRVFMCLGPVCGSSMCNVACRFRCSLLRVLLCHYVTDLVTQVLCQIKECSMSLGCTECGPNPSQALYQPGEGVTHLAAQREAGAFPPILFYFYLFPGLVELCYE